ncbi:MAG: hypothetical protein M0C28_27475 [Candidatus Moduliflexus flocculans]|nr:hypothetical protein [Candidatus Moduliflexus flocculans]
MDFQPIEIGKSVSLSWRVFVLPGSKIGDGAVIGANSLVSHAIPPKCLAVGFPARVVSKFPDFPRDLSIGEKAGLFDDMIGEMIALFRNSGLACEGTGPGYTVSKAGQARPDALPEMAPSRGHGVRRDARSAGLPAGDVDVLVSFGTDRTGRKTETRRPRNGLVRRRGQGTRCRDQRPGGRGGPLPPALRHPVLANDGCALGPNFRVTP